jgi:hypothetical protein
MSDEDNLTHRVAEVQSQLEARVSKENTQAIVAAIGQQGFTQDFLRNVITRRTPRRTSSRSDSSPCST